MGELSDKCGAPHHQLPHLRIGPANEQHRSLALRLDGDRDASGSRPLLLAAVTTVHSSYDSCFCSRPCFVDDIWEQRPREGALIEGCLRHTGDVCLALCSGIQGLCSGRGGRYHLHLQQVHKGQGHQWPRLRLLVQQVVPRHRHCS